MLVKTPLYLADGRTHAGDGFVLPFVKPPEVLLWGMRTFVRRSVPNDHRVRGKVAVGDVAGAVEWVYENVDRYCEAFAAFAFDASQVEVLKVGHSPPIVDQPERPGA